MFRLLKHGKQTQRLIGAMLVIMLVCVFCVCSFAAQGDLTAITPSSGSSLEMHRVNSLNSNYILGLNAADNSVASFVSSLDNPAEQIKAYKNNVQLGDGELLGTGCVVNCVNSSDASEVYETANIVLHGDIDGDGAIDAFDLFYCDKAQNSQISFGDIYTLAADINCDGSVTEADYLLIRGDLADGTAVSQTEFYVFYNTFTTVLEHTVSFLYRVGNGNTVKLGQLFRVDVAGDDAVNGSNVNIKVEAVDSEASVYGSGTNLASGSTAKCVYTKNSSDWTESTLKFTGEGPVKLTINESTGEGYTLNLEVVTANNYASTSSLTATSSNIVLFNDIVLTSGAQAVTKTVYGNGFSVTDNRSDTSGTNGVLNLSGNATLDNVRVFGQVYATSVTSGNTNQCYSPCVWITGGTVNILNSYISECKNALQINNGEVYAKNSTFDGGAVANIAIGGGSLTLEDCVTTTSTRGGIKALGIRPTSGSVKLNIKGSFNQYNWLKKSDLPGTYQTALSSVYNDSTYAYTYNGSAYVNMGVFFFTDSGSITQTEASAAVNDGSTNNYGFIEKTTSSITATLYTAKAASFNASMLNAPDFVSAQYYTLPSQSFDFTTKNYKAKTAGDNNYCYYDSTTDTVMISFDKADSSSSFEWDTDIFSASKYGQSISATVSMGGVDYTGRKISFTESGDYEVLYTYVDTKNYDKDVNASSVTYTKTVNISVTAVEPEDSTYYASFAYDGAAGNYSARKVIGTDSKTYVMPDVTATSSTIGSTTVAGNTVYFPIVTVNPTSSNGNTAYSSGKGYYFAPVFSEIHIIDYNQETGATQYEYSKSTSTWPHSNSATTGPNTSYFTCASGEKVWSGTSPYARSMDSQYYKYGKNDLGVCYTSNDIEKDNSASTHLVQYHYVSTDGETYYYYVQYNFTAMTYSSCVTDGTLVTMADGTKKAIEDIKVGDMVMTWSMWNGCYEAQPVVMHWYHGTQNWEVLTLNFSDGTDVRTIAQHGFFDVDENSYVYIKPDNARDYIGHRFIKQADDGTNVTVTLEGYTLAEETAGSYSIQTAYNENFMVEGMLSMTGEDYKGRFEYFDIGEGMKYDAEKMQADIDRYGLYGYEDFSDYLSPVEFDMFNGKYFKILVGKGVLTHEDILGIIADNLDR